MVSRHLVDPEVAVALELFPAMNLSLETLPLIRAGMSAQIQAQASAGNDTSVFYEEVTIPGPDGAPPVRIACYRPASVQGPLPTILHIHGGGYIIGAPELTDQLNRALVVDLGCAIFSVDYRLAPESKYPAAIEDCYAALAWLNANASNLGIDPTRIGVKGESAGGGLAAALALLVRDRGSYELAFQHLIYPMLDDRSSLLLDPHPYSGQFVWNRAQNLFGWSALLDIAPGSTSVPAYAAAARAEDLTGLPPAFISVGALDLFLEEDVDYALRLTRAAVPVELHVYPGAFHAFELAAQARVSIAAGSHSREALRKALHG